MSDPSAGVAGIAGARSLQQGSWAFLQGGSGLHRAESRSTPASQSLCRETELPRHHFLPSRPRACSKPDTGECLLGVTERTAHLKDHGSLPPEEQQEQQHLHRDGRNQRPV